MRAILDANVLLRILLPSRDPHRAVNVIFDAAQREAFTPLVMDELLDEMRRKATTKPNLATSISPERLSRFESSIRRSGIELPRLFPPFPRVCRDEKDDYLIAYALAGRAEVLVTYDQDLLTLDGIMAFPIVSPAAFLAMLRERGHE